MTSDPTLRRLAAADPAPTTVPAPTPEQIEAVKHRPIPAVATPRRAPRRRWALVPAAVLVAAAAAATVAALIPGSGAPLDLAAAAYAQTSPTRGRIAYTLIAGATTQSVDGRVTSREPWRQESWVSGREAHTVESLYPPGRKPLVTDHVIGTDGVMHHLDSFGTYRIVRPSDNRDSADVIAREQRGFVAEFRRSYERGALDPAGDTRYAGRPARRYVVRDPRDRGIGLEQSFYLDRETGAPLGMVNVRRGIFGRTGEMTTFRFASVVRALSSLPPTAENLRALRTSSIVRRRDEDGCVRGPVTRARSADSARRSDCGGTPGAPVRTP